ncbi:MAG: extracellular solute-binding protein [Oscillospiraceae bacterium]|nr:extracellular solute-binding protein [Oscillospiraceae bacterium]
MLALIMVFALVGPTAFADDNVTISLWTYPIGKWTDEATVKGFIDAFNEIHPEITVKVEYLDYTNGDNKVNTAIEGGQAPDIVMEGPERLIANWGAKGLMLDLSDLVPEGTYEGVASSCTSADGKVFELPVCMTAHCMAINKDVFEAADALQYIDLENHTWTTENFFKAVQAVYDAGNEYVGTVFCGGQGGDQGTRALVTNLYGGTYANAEHTEYTYASEENAKALAALCAQDGITFDPAIVASDEIQNFVNGTFQMAFCWNATQEVNNADALGFDVFPMAFPAEDGVPSLQGGIWGFGVFDNKDEARANAAKEFIKFLTEDDGVYAKVVEATNFQPVRDVEGVYEGNELMAEYALMNPMMGDYYQITKGWTTARTEWWNMLQRVGESDGTVESILTEMTQAQDAANAAAAAE